MRLEIIIPDTTRPEVKARFASLTQRLSAQPELVEQIQLEGDAGIQVMFTLDRLAQIAKANAEIDAGEFYTAEQVRSHFAQKGASWLQNHPN